MRLKGLFWILTTLLLTILAVVTYYVFYTSSIRMFFAVEALVLLTIIYLFVFYRRIIKPLHIIGNGMELLKEQDFSSRLGKVGQTEADRVVDVFNKMMDAGRHIPASVLGFHGGPGNERQRGIQPNSCRSRKPNPPMQRMSGTAFVRRCCQTPGRTHRTGNRPYAKR